jgi:hypothetical protein
MDYLKTEAFRAVFGINLLWSKYVRIMPQVELIRPIDVTSGDWDDPITRPVNRWEARETYYLLIALQY